MFESLKEILQRRIERDTVKSEVSYKPNKNSNEVITETVLLKRSKLPLVGDWARIYPPINEDGTWNIPNLLFGGKKNLVKLVLVLIIVGMVILGYMDLFSYIAVLEERCPPVINTLFG